MEGTTFQRKGIFTSFQPAGGEYMPSNMPENQQHLRHQSFVHKMQIAAK
jgi:hypothetical protein